MDSSQFVCKYEAHCIPQCFCCDFFACDCRMQCPEGCSCYHDNAWDNNIVQCGSRQHSDVPPLIPMDATAVYLDGNNMTDLINPGFIGRRRIKSVFLNNSMIRTITNFSLEGLTEAHIIHLEDNQIEEFIGNEFTSLTNLKELFLQNNYLTTIAAETFSSLKKLSILRLDGNLLSHYPVWKGLADNPMLVGLYLAGNMWSCHCDYLFPFLRFQHRLGSKVMDHDELRCVADHFRGEAVTVMENVQCEGMEEDMFLRNPNIQSSKYEHPSSLDYTPILVSVLLAVLMIIVAYLLAFTFRSSIKEWLYSRSNRGGSGKGSISSGYSSTGSKDKLFDVFISYSVEDRDFVEQSFAPSLEHGATSYRLCLHQRDFPTSSPVNDTVSVAIESSARALVVLSRDYLAHQWDQIRTPFINSIMNNNSKVVVIQLDDVKQEEVCKYPDLKHLLDDSPLVKWGDPGFWNKLRYFLPEPVYLTFHRNVTMRGTLQSSNLYQPVMGSTTAHVLPPFPSCQSSILDITTKVNKAPAYPAQDIYLQNQENTYHSIDSNHIYHTLDPSTVSQSSLYQLHFSGNPDVRQLYINGNLGLQNGTQIIRQGPGATAHVQPISGGGLSPDQLQYTETIPTPSTQNHNHTHTNSTSSAKRLLTPEDSEYIV